MSLKSRLVVASLLVCVAIVALPTYHFVQPTAAAEPQDAERDRARAQLLNQDRIASVPARFSGSFKPQTRMQMHPGN